MKILKSREHITVVSYALFFQRIGFSHGTGCAFECDKDGYVDTAALESNKPAAYASYINCQDRSKYLAPELEDRTHSYHAPAVGKCDHCGADVELYGFTNTCDCGADYNMSGQLLAPREQWGAETGESLSDILNIR